MSSTSYTDNISTPNPNSPLRQHIVMIHHAAEPLRGQGKLVLSSFGQNPTTGEKLHPRILHFEIGDVEGMVAAAERLSQEPHRNIYMSVAVYRPDLPSGSKGGEGDIIGVLGLVADFDDSEAHRWAERLPMRSNMVLETSAWRFQAFYVFDTPLPVEKAKQLAIALKNFAKCDAGTSDVSHVWRIAGTLNHPNKSKIDKGRSRTPQDVKIAMAWDGVLTDADALEGALPTAAENPAEGPNSEKRSGDDFLSRVNSASFEHLEKWVPKVLPTATYQKGTEAWRVRSDDLGRPLEEDLSIHPDGIRDFGEEKGRTPIDVVMEYGGASTALEAAFALCGWMDINPKTLGWSGPAATAAAEHKWTPPHPLPSLPSVPSFDVKMLPDKFATYVADVADRARYPQDFAAVSTMTSFGGLVGRRIGIRMKEKDDWTEHGNVWGMLVGAPSSLKSPAMRDGMSPLKRLQIAADQQAVFDQLKFSSELAGVDIRNRLAKKNAEKALDKDPTGPINLNLEGEPTPPPKLVYWTADVTPEKLGEILAQNPNGVTIERDELSSYMTNLDDDRNATARGLILSGWSGKEGYRFDRIMRGTTAIPAFAISVLGGIQPGPLDRYIRTAFSGERADGLMQRFQLGVWPDSSSFEYVDRWPEKQCKDNVYKIFEFVDRFDPMTIGSPADFNKGPPFIRFDAIAQGLFTEWYTDFMTNRRRREAAGDECAALSAHFGKYPGLLGKLALIIHIADQPTERSVSEQTLEKALAWLRYLEPHARRIYHAADAPKTDAARLLLSRIRQKQLTGPFKARDVYRKEWHGLGDAAQVKAACQMLEDYGYLLQTGIEFSSKGRPADPNYHINPLLLA